MIPTCPEPWSGMRVYANPRDWQKCSTAGTRRAYFSVEGDGRWGGGWEIKRNTSFNPLMQNITSLSIKRKKLHRWQLMVPVNITCTITTVVLKSYWLQHLEFTTSMTEVMIRSATLYWTCLTLMRRQLIVAAGKNNTNWSETKINVTKMKKKHKMHEMNDETVKLTKHAAQATFWLPILLPAAQARAVQNITSFTVSSLWVYIIPNPLKNGQGLLRQCLFTIPHHELFDRMIDWLIE